MAKIKLGGTSNPSHYWWTYKMRHWNILSTGPAVEELESKIQSGLHSSYIFLTKFKKKLKVLLAPSTLITTNLLTNHLFRGKNTFKLQ